MSLLQYGLPELTLASLLKHTRTHTYDQTG